MCQRSIGKRGRTAAIILALGFAGSGYGICSVAWAQSPPGFEAPTAATEAEAPTLDPAAAKSIYENLKQRGTQVVYQEPGALAQLAYLLPFYEVLEELAGIDQSIYDIYEYGIETSAEVASIYAGLKVFDQLPLLGAYKYQRKIISGEPPELARWYDPRNYKRVPRGRINWTFRNIFVKPPVWVTGISLIMDGKKLLNLKITLKRDQVEALMKSVGNQIQQLNAELATPE